ncbi:hypothetical protein BFW01_g8875 [Lasiodiplodia theobromae]|nr:hypothetical protein BFW01_g8875 [Lasiodiplodia theobromae]
MTAGCGRQKHLSSSPMMTQKRAQRGSGLRRQYVLTVDAATIMTAAANRCAASIEARDRVRCLGSGSKGEWGERLAYADVLRGISISVRASFCFMFS